jgi:hypothetical protein
MNGQGMVRGTVRRDPRRPRIFVRMYIAKRDVLVFL